MASRMQYWLFKSEPDTYGIHHLRADGTTPWSGVRNYQARNFMMTMSVGDLGFFYHSSTAIPAIVGVCRVVRAAYPDATALDAASEYYDPKASPEKPIWENVDVAFESEFAEPITLATLRNIPALADMLLLARGSRLSVQPVAKPHWTKIMKLTKTTTSP